MTRYVAGGLTTAGSTTLPVCALVGSAAVKPWILEIGVFNTTATAVALKLGRLSGAGAGTPGATMTADDMDGSDLTANVALLKNTYSSTAPTVLSDLGFRCILGGAIGSGFVWTFETRELGIPSVASNAIALMVENGTGQALQVYWKWIE
jgi:hypothetical protein